MTDHLGMIAENSDSCFYKKNEEVYKKKAVYGSLKIYLKTNSSEIKHKLFLFAE